MNDMNNYLVHTEQELAVEQDWRGSSMITYH